MNNSIYRSYCESIGADGEITDIADIPYLPITAFKHHDVLLDTITIEECTLFTSSGTTQTQVSKHYVVDEGLYHLGTQQIFEESYGALEDYHVFGLLPAYLERKGSSLVSMVDYFIKQSRGGGFYLYDHKGLYEKLSSTPGKILLIGVSFGLLDFAEKFKLTNNEQLIVMETGGMKGRHKEMPRAELHQVLLESFGCQSIHSEYGMTELCSQAYSSAGGIFNVNPYFQVRVREISDPFAEANMGKSGIICITDLNNINSCSFIETQDLGRMLTADTFEVLGRVDNSDLRGCNLMVG